MYFSSSVTYRIISCYGIIQQILVEFLFLKKLFCVWYSTYLHDPLVGQLLEHRKLTLASIFISRCLVFAKENVNIFVKLSSLHLHNTRNKEISSIFKHRTSKFIMSLEYHNIKLLNHLPSYIKSLSSIKFEKIVFL